MRRVLHVIPGNTGGDEQAAPTGASASTSTSPSMRRWHLTQLVVVTANAMQLVLMIAFVALLLQQLNGHIRTTWYAIFSPLWASDAITLATGAYELRRLLKTSSEHPRRNALINQINRLKGCICVAVFKGLLTQRLDGVWPNVPIRVVCIPYYVAAVLRFVLHYLKQPVLQPHGSGNGTLRRVRPGSPINPGHIMVVIIACRLDGLIDISWAVTFLPMFLLFGFLAIISIGVGCLAVGILLMREPEELGQRTLFFICFCILVTITSCGTAFLVKLTSLLDGDASVSYASVLVPLIVGYSVLLICYLTFTLVLPRLLLHDLNMVATAQEEVEEDDEGGMLELVSQQLAPPFLVQQSGTLFKRMNSTAMLERVLRGVSGATPDGGSDKDKAPADGDAVAERSSTLSERELASSALELGVLKLMDEGAAEQRDATSSTSGVARTAGAQSSRIPEGEKASSSRSPQAVVHEGSKAASPGVSCSAVELSSALTNSELSEYLTLQAEIEKWLQAQRVSQPAAEKAAAASSKGAAQAGGQAVPAEIKRKLQRFSYLKQQLAAAACEACGNPTTSGQRFPADPHGTSTVASRGAASASPVPLMPEAVAGAAPRGTSPLHAGVESTPQDAGSSVEPAPSCIERAVTLPTSSHSNHARGETSTTPRPEPDADAGVDDDEGAGAGGKEPAETLCWICFEGPRDAVLLECGHGGICMRCAKRLCRKKGRICPMCRQTITQVVQVQIQQQEGGVGSGHSIVCVKQPELPEEWTEPE